MVKKIQNYTIHQQIGQGQYGKVYRGIDCRTDKQVAVKVINVKKFKEYPKLEECTLNEIEVLSKIDSPHIVKFYEILKTTNNFYFFYEFCNQGTLEDVIKSKGVLPQSQVLEYLSQILQAFYILSNKNIMHRDLKPSNILMSDSLIKLADFGFCKSLQNHRDLAQTMLGSPIYMAPQVLKGQIYTIKADIWSLGVVIYEMLYGFCPFEERSIARLINLLDNNENVSFNSQINNISQDLEKLIKKMLVKDHFKRMSWAEIFEYKVNGKKVLKSLNNANVIDKCNYINLNGHNSALANMPLLKTVSDTEQRDKDQTVIQHNKNKIDAFYNHNKSTNNELKDISNYENIKEQRPSSRPSITLTLDNTTKTQNNINSHRHNKSYSLYNNSGTGSNNQSAKKQSTSNIALAAINQNENNKPSMPSQQTLFKKKSSTTSTHQQSHYSQHSKQSNKQNVTVARPSINVTLLDNTQNIRNKIRFYIKVANDVIQMNLCPDLAPAVCLKIYNIIWKEHNKLKANDDNFQVRNQRLALKDAIKIFEEENSKISHETVSANNGPLLTHYIKTIQNNHKEYFSNGNNYDSCNNKAYIGKQKDILEHCVALLNLNEFSSSKFKISELSAMEATGSKENRSKIIAEINQKVIRNII